MTTKLKIRDLLAVPFWATAQLLDRLAIHIGGRWTAEMFAEQAVELAKKLREQDSKL